MNGLQEKDILQLFFLAQLYVISKTQNQRNPDCICYKPYTNQRLEDIRKTITFFTTQKPFERQQLPGVIYNQFFSNQVVLLVFSPTEQSNVCT